MKVIYDTFAYRKIMHWVMEAKTDEISGFGTVKREGDIFYVLDAMLLPQRNGAGHTDIEGTDVARTEYLLRNKPGEVRLWWHSHVKMDVFWSGTDMATIKLLGQGGWFLNTVFNQRWENRTALYIGGDNKFFLDDLDTSHNLLTIDPALTVQWNEEFKTNVTDVAHQDEAKKQAALLDEWEPTPLTELSNREQALILKKNISAILITKNYGKVFWSFDDGYSRMMCHRATPHIKTSVFLSDLLEDTLLVRWMSPVLMEDKKYYLRAADFYQKKMGVVVDYMTARRKKPVEPYPHYPHAHRQSYEGYREHFADAHGLLTAGEQSYMEALADDDDDDMEGMSVQEFLAREHGVELLDERDEIEPYPFSSEDDDHYRKAYGDNWDKWDVDEKIQMAAKFDRLLKQDGVVATKALKEAESVSTTVN